MVGGKHGVVATDTLFDCTIELFNFVHLLITRGYLKYCVEINKVILHGFELVIG